MGLNHLNNTDCLSVNAENSETAKSTIKFSYIKQLKCVHIPPLIIQNAVKIEGFELVIDCVHFSFWEKNT